MEQNTIQVRFKMRQFQPDQRKFQTSKSLFEPIKDFIVIVDVPLQHEYIYNAEDIIKQQLAADKVDSPIWKPAGLAYIEDRLLERVPVEGTSATNNQNSDNYGFHPTEKDIEWEDD